MQTSQVHNRFKDAPWFNNPQEIILVGLGGIGRGVAEELIKLGHSLYIYEDDIVETHNCLPQGYKLSQIGKKKAAAFVADMEDYGFHNSITLEAGKYSKNSLSSPIMISCVDNMQARKDIFENWRKQKDALLFLDGRMLAEYFEIFTVTPDKKDLYIPYLFPDSDVEAEPCTYKQTSFCSKILHGLMIQQFNNWLVNHIESLDLRAIHFKNTYNGFTSSLSSDVL